MISINLLPDVKKELLRIRRERNLVITVSIFAVGGSIAALVILGGILGGLNIAKVVTENSINTNKATINSAIEDKQLNEYLTIQNQLAQIDGLKSQQLVYSRIMDYLVQLNPASPNNAELSSVDLDTSSSAVTAQLEGTVQNFEALNVYKTTLASAELVYEEKSEDGTSSEVTDSSSSDGGNSETSGNNDTSTTDNTDAQREKLFTVVSVDEQGYSNSGDGVSFVISVTFSEKAFSQTIDDDSLRVEVPKETTSDGDRNAPKTEDESESDNSDQGSSAAGNGNDGDDQRHTFNSTETDDTTSTTTGENN